jgi:hypothetical protein
MFKLFRRSADPSRQIPYTLYESLQENSPRRRRTRAFLEVTLVAAAVLGLAFGTAAVYKHLSRPNPTTSTNQPTIDNTDGSNGKQTPDQGKTPDTPAPDVTQKQKYRRTHN